MQGRGLETPVSPLAGSPRADGLGWVDRAPIPPSQPMELQVDSLFFFTPRLLRPLSPCLFYDASVPTAEVNLLGAWP